MRELHDEREPPLAELVSRMSPADITIVEGFTRERLPRLEVVRTALSTEPLYETDAAILAIASDDPASISTTLPVLQLNDIDSIGAFICKTLGM
jgi:molybdopterin-guanine dinucleotide biosynthesis protein B